MNTKNETTRTEAAWLHTIGSAPIAAKKPSQLNTAADVIKAIPPKWRAAEMVVADRFGSCKRIVRVSLHKNAAGRQVILIHQDDFS